MALMKKKELYKESSFIARSMISSISDEDNEISLMSNVFTSILSHDDFVEFGMSPLRQKKHIKDMHAMSVSSKLTVPFGAKATQRRIQNFVEYIGNMVVICLIHLGE